MIERNRKVNFNEIGRLNWKLYFALLLHWNAVESINKDRLMEKSGASVSLLRMSERCHIIYVGRCIKSLWRTAKKYTMGKNCDLDAFD